MSTSGQFFSFIRGPITKFFYLLCQTATQTFHRVMDIYHIFCLLFQDFVVGLLFALLPILGGNSGVVRGIVSMAKL